MKLIVKIVKGAIWAILFILFFGLAIKNMQSAELRFFLGYEARMPLILLLFAFFIAGSVFGVLGMGAMVFRHRREASRHKKTIVVMQKESEARELARSQPDAVAGN